ncbi:ATP-binding cassette (ABC) Superfamily [Phytophthora palmivora]|uniref:ATP-binding cassette (ABC) Superfamily n=1 Tax=Phytophthora palmivora TaxID=4796 RepID=A0A2P4YF67_9STRA|nr:ATP-binding cassette (ABC) Superfamily [Phytophthora palmivora]
MFLEHLKAPPCLSSNEPLFVNDIEAARCVLLASHRIHLKEFASLRKKPEDRGELFPVWGYPWVQPENTTTQTQAEDLFWRWFRTKKNPEKIACCPMSWTSATFASKLPAKRQLHSVMEGLRLLSKSSAQDERGYGSVNRTVHRKAAKKPRTTYAPAVDPKSQQPSGSQPGAALPAPTSSVTRGNLDTLLAAGASQSAAALGRPAPHGSGARRSDQGGQEELSHACEYEAPSQPYPSGPSTSGRDSVGSLLSDEVRQLRDRVYAIEIALGLGPGGQAASQAGKPGTLEVLRQDLDALGRETHELHGRVDRRAPASALKELRRGLDVLSHEVMVVCPLMSRRGIRTTRLMGIARNGAHTVQPQRTLLPPGAKILRTIVPFKTPHEVDGIGGAMLAEGPNGSNEARLQLVTPNGANQR